MNCSTQSSKSTDLNKNWVTKEMLENAASECGCVFSYIEFTDKYVFEYLGNVIATIDNPDSKLRPVWRIVTYHDSYEYHDSGFLDENFEVFKQKMPKAMQGIKLKNRDRLKKEIEEESKDPLI